MLALKEGGRTTGVAYRLPDATLEEELTLLWKREMITGCYMPSWCKLELDDGRTVNALVFIMDPRHPLYEADTRTQVIAPLIAAASGPLGTNAQYLFSLDQELTRLGMKDDCLNELVVKVKALLEGNPLNSALRPGFACQYARLAGRLNLCCHVADGMLQRLAVAINQHIPRAGIRHGKPGLIVLYGENIRLGLFLCFRTHQMNTTAF